MITFTVEYGMYGMHSRPMPGARWRATFAIGGQFYAGSADSPWEAVAWALVEREQRTRNGNHPTMARPEGQTPAQAMELVKYPLRGQFERSFAVADSLATVRPIAELIADSSIGAGIADIKERGIDAHLLTLEAEQPSAAARRSRARKKAPRG